MELLAFRREGSNKHIKGCERASEQLKLEIHAMNNRERERATELASIHDMESTSFDETSFRPQDMEYCLLIMGPSDSIQMSQHSNIVMYPDDGK
ncbi:hypothetical protein R1flu_028749 [Riccia fluitans]|uniref:Uncharacterized protein n=1 Tax=Riccia fluitans TaxID=41844 RepID=A0ABD1XML6_9MARC